VNDDSNSLWREVIDVGMQSIISYNREWDTQDDIIHVQWIVLDILLLQHNIILVLRIIVHRELRINQNTE
jgi:hypothetical protein